MKKIISLIIVIAMVLTIFTSVYAEVTLSDVKSNDWFYSNINEMINLGIVNGYTDGTFKPQNSVQADEFIKMLIIGMGYQPNLSDSTYWADGFITKAEELKIIDKTFINDYRYNLTREQAARIIKNALNLNETRPAKTYDDYIKTAIKDYHKIQSKHVQDVIDVYAYGIMQGDALGYMHPKDTITRAEATTVILRMMDKDRRLSLEDKLQADNNSIKLIDAEGTEHIVVAPLLNNEPVTEFIDVAKLYIETTVKTKGIDTFKYIPWSNLMGASGVENQVKYDYIQILNAKTELSNEELTKAAMYNDYTFNIDLLDLKGKYTPYRFNAQKNIGWFDDVKYKNQVGKWGDYFTEYYLDSFKPVFKYLFEDDFDKAWSYFITAVNSTDETWQNKSAVLNERYFDIGYDLTAIKFSISLKNQYK